MNIGTKANIVNKNLFIIECAKYVIIYQKTGANTQAVESFNNILKLRINARKAIKQKKVKLN